MGSNPRGMVVPVAVTLVAASRAVAGVVTAAAAGTAAMATAPAAHVAAPTIAARRFSITLSKTHGIRRWLYCRRAVILVVASPALLTSTLASRPKTELPAAGIRRVLATGSS
jgi:hypothetical protein